MPDPAAALPEHVLRAVAAAAADRRLPWPVSEAALQQVTADIDQGARGALLALSRDAADLSGYSRILSFVADQKRSVDALTPKLELVTSGPDPRRLSRATGVVVRSLFSEARERILVAGFAVHQGRKVFRLLSERLNAGDELSASLILNVARPVGDTSTSEAIVNRFAADFVAKVWPGRRLPKIYYDPRAVDHETAERASFHSKCIAVDYSKVLITSANLTVAAQQRNFELGVLIQAPAMVRLVEQYFSALIDAGHLVRLPVR